jgi:hypothetical protein
MLDGIMASYTLATAERVRLRWIPDSFSGYPGSCCGPLGDEGDFDEFSPLWEAPPVISL